MVYKRLIEEAPMDAVVNEVYHTFTLGNMPPYTVHHAKREFTLK